MALSFPLRILCQPIKFALTCLKRSPRPDRAAPAVPEAKYGALVRHHVFEGIESGKLTQQRYIVECFFHCRVRVAEPLLHEMNPQHRTQGHRRVAVAFLRIKQLDPGLQPRPWDDCFHFRQKYRLAGCFPRFQQKSRFSQTQLFHRFHLFGRHHDNGASFSFLKSERIMVTCAEFPQGHHLQVNYYRKRPTTFPSMSWMICAGYAWSQN